MLDIVIIVHFSSKNVVLNKPTAMASICVLNFIKMKTVCFSDRHMLNDESWKPPFLESRNTTITTK